MSNQIRIDFNAPKYPETVILNKEGDVVEGEVTEMGGIPLPDRIARYLHIDTAKGIRTLWLGKVLTVQCEKEHVKRGDYVGIRYLGEVDSGKQSPYKNYDLRVIPPEPEIDTGGLEE